MVTWTSQIYSIYRYYLCLTDQAHLSLQYLKGEIYLSLQVTSYPRNGGKSTSVPPYFLPLGSPKFTERESSEIWLMSLKGFLPPTWLDDFSNVFLLFSFFQWYWQKNSSSYGSHKASHSSFHFLGWGPNLLLCYMFKTKLCQETNHVKLVVPVHLRT